MFAIVVEGLDQPKRRSSFEGAHRAISIGRSTQNDVVLPRPEVSRRHACIKVEKGKPTLFDLGSSHGTYVNGKRIDSHVIVAADRIRIGPFALAIEPNIAGDPTEQSLLAAITERQDDTSRLVYADWLEERGEVVKAEFLRIQEALVGQIDVDHAKTTRLRQLAASIEIRWRHAVARPAVEGCAPRFSFKCPREWGSFSVTDRPDVRHCDGCNKHVYYCSSVDAARKHSEMGDCVAVDVIPLRKPGDLKPAEAVFEAIAPGMYVGPE